MRKLRALALFGALSLTLACGGGSGGSGGGGTGGGGGIAGCTNGTAASPGGNSLAASATNVTALVIDGGPPTLTATTVYVNGVFTTVTVCVPGSTTTCQDIDHVLVDTGSYGLRLLSNSGGGVLTAALSSALPQQQDTSGDSIAECAQFSDGITWGPVKMADIYVGGLTRMAGESAKTVPGSGTAGLPVQIIGDPNFTTVPSACTAFGTPEDTLKTLLANGIIGVGPFPADCGSACSSSGTDNPGFYYACPSGVCSSSTQPTTHAEAAQVWNPVAAFAKDNNGVILELPSIPAAGLPLVNGSLVFGIGTESNNALGKATILMGDNSANITTTFAGTPSSNSFIDSGSNGYFFSSSIPTCTSSKGFYCPTSPLTCSATNADASGHSSTVNFNVANADQLVAPNTAFDNIAGPNTPPAGSSGSVGFDWGLPFFYGRNVYTGMFPVAGVTATPPGVPTGPFFAY